LEGLEVGKLDALTAAQLSAAAYPDWKQSGQSLPEGWSAGPTFVSQSGNNSITVFFNPSTGQAVLAFKGSDNLSNFKSDLLDSGAAAWNETKPLALQALAAATSAGYETSNISTDGHSLGGGMAQTFALENGLSGYGQNSLPISQDALVEYFGSVSAGNTAVAAWKTKGNTFDEMSFPLFFVFQPIGIMPPISVHAEC
jgi:hypothetical protein